MADSLGDDDQGEVSEGVQHQHAQAGGEQVLAGGRSAAGTAGGLGHPHCPHGTVVTLGTDGSRGVALQVLELHQAGGGAGCCAGSNCPSAPTGRTLVLHQTQEGSGEQARVEYRLDTENPDLLEVK